MILVLLLDLTSSLLLPFAYKLPLVDLFYWLRFTIYLYIIYQPRYSGFSALIVQISVIILIMAAFVNLFEVTGLGHISGVGYILTFLAMLMNIKVLDTRISPDRWYVLFCAALFFQSVISLIPKMDSLYFISFLVWISAVLFLWSQYRYIKKAHEVA